MAEFLVHRPARSFLDGLEREADEFQLVADGHHGCQEVRDDGAEEHKSTENGAQFEKVRGEETPQSVEWKRRPTQEREEVDGVFVSVAAIAPAREQAI